MNKLITTEGFIADKQLIRKLGKVGILLSYYIDCYNFYTDESGVFYRSRVDTRNDTNISYEAQQAYEKKLVKLGLLDITYGNVAQSNRIKLHPESIILYRDAQTTSVVAQTKTFMAQTDLVDAQTISLVNERIPTDERTEITTDVPTDTQLTDVKRWILNNNVPTSSIINQQFPELTEEQITTLRNEAVDESFYL
jgi:hypothetical protein